jgi:hypothetical protein
MYRPPQVIVGAKLPLRPMHVWAIRVRLQIERRFRDLALFDIALDSKLRGCDVVSLRLASVDEPLSFSRRLADPFSSRLRSKRAGRWPIGSRSGAVRLMDGCSQVGWCRERTSRRANISVW